MSFANYDKIISKKYHDTEAYNPNKSCPQHPFRMLIVGSSGSGKTSALLDIIFKCACFCRIFLIAKDLEEPKYRYLIDYFQKIEQKVGFVEILSYTDDLSEAPDVDTLDKSIQNLIIFDDMISDSNLNSLMPLFIRSRKKNTSIIFLSQAYHKLPKTLRIQCNYLVSAKQTLEDRKKIYQEWVDDTTEQQFMEAFMSITKNPFHFFIIDKKTKNLALKYRDRFSRF